MARTGENIYKRKDGRWEGRYIFSYNEMGKARYKYVYARTYSEVKNKLLYSQLQMKDMIRGSLNNGNQKYECWLDRWLWSKKPVVKDSTFMRYKNHIENHIKPELGLYPVHKIGTALVEGFVLRKLQQGKLDGSGGLSQKTMSDVVGIIKSSLNYTRSHGITTICCFDSISLKTTSKEIRVLSVDEEQRLLKVLFNNFDRYKLGVFICLYTGIRIGELCALNSMDFSINDKTVKIKHTMQRLQYENRGSGPRTRIVITTPKTESSIRELPLPDFVVEKLIPFLGSPDSFILTGNSEVFVEPRTMENRFKTYLKEAEICEVNFHVLRHTFATRCIESGFDVKTLSEILGHSSVKVTLDKYVHSSMQLKRDNMEKLRLLTM